MKRINLYFVVGTAVLAVLAVAACARDRGDPAAATGPTARIEAAVAEGATVRATVHDAVAVPGGAVTQTGAASTAAEAVVRRGLARDPASGAFLAAAAGNGVNGEKEFQFTDDGGHRHRLVVRGQPGHGPIASARYERDGALVAEVAWRWDARGGGWVLRERSLTLFRDGHVLLRQVREAEGVGVTPADAVADGGSLPPVQRTMVLSCEGEWAAYIGASATLLIAGEVFTLFPSSATATAALAAAGAWEQALNNLVTCELRAAGVIA